MASANIVRHGSIMTSARKRGTTRNLTGFNAMLSSASTCSVTFIVPSSALIAAPTLPAITRPVRTGPNSRVMETATRPATYITAPNDSSCGAVCMAITIPVNKATKNTIKSELTPTNTICSNMLCRFAAFLLNGPINNQ